MNPNPLPPLFDTNAKESLAIVSATFNQRGDEYGDTWRDCQWLAMKSAAEKAGIHLDTQTARLLAAAALYDVKYQRLQGGYKEDSIIDGIAYAANFRSEMKSYIDTRPRD